MTSPTPERLAWAAEIIADLKNAGGWDLTGYEDFFAAPDIEEVGSLKLGPVRDREIRVKREGEWVSFGTTNILDIETNISRVDVSAFGGPVQKREGLREITISIEVELTNDRAELARSICDEYQTVECLIGAHGKTLSTSVVFYQMDMEFSDVAWLKVSMRATKEMTAA